MEKMKSLEKLQSWLGAYLNFEKLPQKNIFWLDTMQFFCRRFGEPQDCAPAFHVAGSKGKGSVATFIASILEASGFSAGLYTSPHIIDFAERITRCHRFFDEGVYDRAVDEIMGGISRISPGELPGNRPVTWFELVTLFAFLVFRQANVDFSVFEVGLGGRLDATNVISPRLCVITPIELEHTEFLGDTVEKIAAEKGGIIKERVPVVVSGQKDSVRAVFERIAKEKNAPIYFFDDVVKCLSCTYEAGKVENIARCPEDSSGKKSDCLKNDTSRDCFNGSQVHMRVQFESPLFSRKICADLGLLGEVQAQNAALAACAVKLAIPEVSERNIEEGLARAFLPGRFEIVRCPSYAGIPAIVLDGAHTVNSCRFTMETFSEVFSGEKSAGNCALLFGCAQDKDSADIAPLFRGVFGSVFLTIPGRVKKSDLRSVEKSFSDCGIPFDSSEDFCAQIKKALDFSNAHNAVLLVTGSFYLVSEVKKLLAEMA